MLASYFPFLLLIGMPILVIAFVSDGVVGGPTRLVPGLATMFGLFGVTVVGMVFFRDHGWNTWNRLRASPATPTQVLVGKALPLLVLFIAQQLVLLVIGWAFFGMPWRGGIPETALLVVAIVAVETSLGMLIVAFCNTIEQLAVWGYLTALLMVGFGGALAPLSRMPEWVQTAAPASPVYWMERGFDVVLTGDRTFGDLLISVAVLAAMSTCGLVVTARCYRFDAPKGYFPQ